MSNTSLRKELDVLDYIHSSIDSRLRDAEALMEYQDFEFELIEVSYEEAENC